ncbi:MAG: putative polysaccharide deacetylase [Acidimicrobiales bacterium]|nr:putative polysaccharide deacetylase [Acidimicrobiales bacterium]
MSSVGSKVARAVTTGLGAAPVGAAWRRLRPGLRILAYHDVPDAEAFEAQLAMFARHHRFVDAATVAEAFRGERTLPADALWLTFDDADPSVVRTALPVLAARRVPATLYVCPGLLQPPSPPWWTVVAEAGRAGRGATVGGRALEGPELVRALKVVPDAERRQLVAAVDGARPPDAPAPTMLDEVRSWLEAGQEVGNHTWDHPCLDHCTPAEQTEQITRAHDWFREQLGLDVRTFAYPNGDRTDHAAQVLEDLGYETVLLFDHRLAHPAPGRRELSRLRLDASAPLARARAVSSGSHADVMRAGARVASGLRRGR